MCGAAIGFGVLILLVVPGGYLENYRVFGNPLGDRKVQALQSPLGAPVSELLEQGSKNLFRLGLDFISLDGFPAGTATRQPQEKLRVVPVRLVQALHLDLEEHPTFRAGFTYPRPPRAHEDSRYRGILGFALVAPVLLWVLFSFRGMWEPWVLRCAALLCL